MFVLFRVFKSTIIQFAFEIMSIVCVCVCVCVCMCECVCVYVYVCMLVLSCLSPNLLLFFSLLLKS